MARHMPGLESFFHYRNLDVSTLKILMQRWRPELEAGISKTGAHLALDDIRESIEEMRYYRDHFLKMAPSGRAFQQLAESLRASCCASAQATCSCTSSDGNSRRASSAAITSVDPGALPNATARLRNQRS